MASVTSPETELLRASGNQLNYSDMAQLADGRFVSVGQEVRDVRIRLTDPSTGEIVEVDDLRGDDLRGAEHSGATRTLHTLHNTEVAALADGGFVVAAQLNQNIDGSFSNYEQIVYLQYYNADGSPSGDAIRGRDPETDGDAMSTETGTVDLLEHPEGVVLVFRQNVGTLSDPERPGMVARFFDADGSMVAEHVLHTERGYLPQSVVVEGDEFLLMWFERSEGSILFPRDYVPAALAHQRFELDGTAMGPKTRIEEAGGGEHMRLLQTPEGALKLLYLAPGNELRMTDLGPDMAVTGGPITILGPDDAPGGDGSWGMETFAAALDAEGGITVALVADINEEAGESDTREDIFVVGFNLDGSLRSAPVQASETARGIQGDPVLVTQDDGTLYLQFMQFERPEVSGDTQLIGVEVTPGATAPDPEPEPEPLPGPGPDTGIAVEVNLTLPGSSDPAGVVVTFRSDDGETLLSVTASEDGAYRFDVAPGVAGRLDVAKAWDPATDPGISSTDALDVLRMAVGLAPSFGASTPGKLIAGDLDRDGSVTSKDALEILRAAVGLDSDDGPRWIFVEPDLDLSGIEDGEISFETGVLVSDLSTLSEVDLSGILLGHMGL